MADFLQLHFVRHARQSLREGETTVGFASALLFNLGIQTLPGCTLKLYTLFKHHDVWMFMQKKYEDPQLKRGPETLMFSAVLSGLLAGTIIFNHQETNLSMLTDCFAGETAGKRRVWLLEGKC